MADVALTAGPTRVSLADALLARRAAQGQPAALDIRATLDAVRQGVQAYTDAASLREILAGLAQVRPDAPPAKDEVSSIEKIVNIGKDLMGTPTERERALREELEDERTRRKALEDALADLKEEIWSIRKDRRQEDRDATVTMIQAFSAMMDKFMDFSRQVTAPAENDPLRQIGTIVLQSFVNRKPGEDLQQVKEVLGTLKELGVLAPQTGSINDPSLFKHVLDYNARLYEVDRTTQATLERAKAETERMAQLGAVLGPLGVAFLARVAGEDAARDAAGTLLRPPAGEAPAGAPTPAPTATPDATEATPPIPVPRGRARPQMYRCGACGFEFVARQPLTDFVCPACQTHVAVRASGAAEA